MSTGEVQRWVLGKVPTNGAVLATAGDVIFFGDLNRRFRAFDADSGKILWETILGNVAAEEIRRLKTFQYQPAIHVMQSY